MPTTIFDWLIRTAMLVMAGLVTLSILGAIATMTNDPGTGFAGGERPVIEAPAADERQAAQVPSRPQEDARRDAAGPAGDQGPAVAAARPAPDDALARWLEAIAYALLAIAGIGALAVLMLWSAVRELRRIGGSSR